MNEYKTLFSPLTLRGVTLKNRVVMMPMGSNFAGHDGELTDDHAAYYTLRAKGGTGLILAEWRHDLSLTEAGGVIKAGLWIRFRFDSEHACVTM